MPIIHDADLEDVLLKASSDDVRLLIDIITDNGKGRTSLSSSVCKQLCAAREGDVDEFARALVAEEITRFGGNSLMNLLRKGSGVSYRELLSDVVSHVGAKTSETDCAEMEMAVISKVVEQSLDRMSDEEKKIFFDSVGINYLPGKGPGALAALIAGLNLSGVATYHVAAMVANATMSSLVGRGVMLAGGATLGRGVAVLVGPVGWAITGIWTAFDLASPAYRVTVPCVIQIGYMRQKILQQNTCLGCQEIVVNGSNFCSNCGARVSGQERNR